jgi:hypothetical protein
MDAQHEQAFAPRPGEIKKVIIVTHSGGGIKTYDNLIEAVTAVYRLDNDLKRAIETAVQMATGEASA